MRSSTIVRIAKISYLLYRLRKRVTIGKKRRDDYIIANKITWKNFIPTRFYENKPITDSYYGFKAIPREYTDDFLLLFIDREKQLKKHIEVKQDEVFADVGANVGYYTLAVASRNKKCQIVAIEAHPDTFDVLNKNIKCNNFRNIQTVNKAVSNNTGKIRIYEHTDTEGNQKTGMYDTSNRYNAKSFIEVKSDTLDNIFDSLGVTVDIMKIDIEGAEIEALLGANKTLDKLSKIIVEIHGDNLTKVKEMLHDKGFHTTLEKGGMNHLIGEKRKK